MAVPCSSFYGSNKEVSNAVLPRNPLQSDGDDSTSEEEIFAYDSDSDPEWVPQTKPGTINPNLTVISDSDSDSIQPTNPDLVQPSTSFASDMCPPKRKKQKKSNRPCYRWKKEDIPTLIQESVVFEEDAGILTAMKYFMMYFTSDMFEYISEQTNLYSFQCDQVSVRTNSDEIKILIAILLHMGVVRLPSYEDYWAPATRVPQVADIMPLKRFKKLRRYIHFNNNEAVTTDKYFKVRPILDKFRKQCLLIKEENKFSCDETMVPYKGTRAGNLRQYLASKPHKWGFKFFVRAGVSGLVYDLLPYCGQTTFNHPDYESVNDIEFGVGPKVILALCNTIAQPEKSTVYFDNFFTSVPLLCYLLQQKNIKALGTIRSNRLSGCPLTDDKTLTKMGRGSYDYRSNDEGVIVVKWADSKCVQLASTVGGVEPVGTVSRYDKIAKKKVPVKCPQVVKLYNEHMGGVDLSNMFIELYRTPMKAKRWYLPIFGYVLDVSVSNAWLLYRRDLKSAGIKKYMPLKTFRCLISEGLRNADKPRRGRPTTEEAGFSPTMIKRTVIPRPVDDSRYDQLGHFPIHAQKGRCRFCTKGTGRIQCMKCKVTLCLNADRNCFLRFHVKDVPSN